jgi:two-component system OmpR family sensor kinase
MAGRKGDVSRSLQSLLFLWLSVAIILVAVPAGFLSYWYAFREAIELQDDQLRQTAAWLEHQHFSVPPVEAAGPADADPESRLIVLTAEPQRPWRPEGAAPGLNANASDGLQTATIGGVPWRFLVGADERGFRIAVGQQTAARDEIANKSALRTVAPLMSLIVLLPLVIGVTVRQMLRPLKGIADNLEVRSEIDWVHIPERGLPTEIRPFVVAIKRLLTRVAASVAEQRRFLADAAHELRSPLTALSLQAERLESAEMSVEARERLIDLRRGILRTRRLLEQLLALARAQNETGETQPVSLTVAFRRALEDLMPLAEAKGLDVGLVSRQEVVVQAREIDLTMLLRNLIENAIRYTPDGGRIDLSAEMRPDGAALRVEDSGPGIRPEDRERVFDPFHRVLGADEFGSGLGLSIVKAIVDRLGADISLGDAPGGGLEVTVTIPKTLIRNAASDQDLEDARRAAGERPRMS